MLVARVLQPASKLATARALPDSTLASELRVERVDEDDLYRALDWLSERQDAIERRLARRHLGAGEHALYDVSSTYFEGRTCPLAELGYSRDGKRGTPQLVYGLLCDRRGRPLSAELFPGGLHEDQTLPATLRLWCTSRRPPSGRNCLQIGSFRRRAGRFRLHRELSYEVVARPHRHCEGDSSMRGTPTS